ncbi:MAG: diguanylate cyclase [Candidatus Melainabacteria bacterium]|nr:diguanylate cyclase [Candidatus Melainabacteria bacterium]
MSKKGPAKKGADKPAAQEGILAQTKHALTEVYGKVKSAVQTAQHPPAEKPQTKKPAPVEKPRAKAKAETAKPAEHRPAAKKPAERPAQAKHGQAKETVPRAKGDSQPQQSKKQRVGDSAGAKKPQESGAKAKTADTPAKKKAHDQAKANDSATNKKKPAEQVESKETKNKQGKESPKSIGINFKDVTDYFGGKNESKTDSKQVEKKAEKLLDEFKQEAKQTLSAVKKIIKPVEESFKALGNELHRQQKHITDLLPHAEEPQRKPRQMNTEEAKREERIAKMKPEDRARFKVIQHEDPKTHVIYQYNAKGLITETETLNGQRKEIDYKPGSNEPTKLKISQLGGDQKTNIEYKSDVNHRILVDQNTGNARVDFKQVTPEGKEQNVEDHFGADGTRTKILSQKGHRLSKEMHGTAGKEVKKIATLNYRYTDENNKDVPPAKINDKSKCTVTQTDSQGAARHQFGFESPTAAKEWKPKTQIDIGQPKEEIPGTTTQKSVTYDLTKGKERISETDVTTKIEGENKTQKTETFNFDLAQIKTKVYESDVSIHAEGEVATQTTENFEYINGKAQKLYHSQETLDRSTGSSSSEEFSYSNGKVIAKDFSRKEVTDTTGDTKITTTAIRKDKTVQHREASFDGTGVAVSLKSEEGGHSLSVNFGPDGKVASTIGKLDILRDGKPIATARPTAAEKKRVQAEIDTLSGDAARIMKELHDRYDVRAQVKQQRHNPTDEATADKTSSTAVPNKPVELTSDDRTRLKDMAANLRQQAGYNNNVFTYADGKALEEILRGCKNQTEINELKKLYRIGSNGEDLEKQMAACKHFQGSGEFLLKSLLTKDPAEVTALTVRRILEEQQETTGRSNWEINNDLRKSLAHLNGAQIDEAEKVFQKLFPDQGSMGGAILSSTKVPQEIKDALPFYFNGVDKLSERDKLKLADIALESKNLDMFKEVTGRFDEKTRTVFNENDDRQKKLSKIFSGQQLEQAKAAASGGISVIVQEINDNSGAWTNREGVRGALNKLTDEQRRQYLEGKHLEYRVESTLTDDQKNSLRLYQSLHGELSKCVSTSTATGLAELQGFEDSIALKGGGLVSNISQGAGYMYNTGAQEQLDKIANMSESDWQKLNDYVKGTHGPGHSEYRQQLEQTLRDMQGYRIQDKEIKKILTLYDKKMGADSFTQSKLSGQKDVLDVLYSQRGYITNDRSAALDAISNMTPDEQVRYRTDAKYQKQVNAELEHFTQITGKSHAYEQAQRMLNMYKSDDSGVLAQFRTINNMPEQERRQLGQNEKALKNLEDSIKTMTDIESRSAAQRMLTQLRDGRQPEMLDVFGKLSAQQSQWVGDPRQTVKAMEDAFKDDPSLFKRIQNPLTPEDRKLSAQFKEISNAALGSKSIYADNLLNSKDGRLPLEQKLQMHKGVFWNDRQGMLNDIANASPEELQLLKDKTSKLRKNVDRALDDWREGVYGITESDKGQRQVIENVLRTGKLETHDKIRSYVLDTGYSSNIMELLHTTPPDKLDKLCDDYSKNYHKDLRSELIAKLGKKDAAEALNLLYKPTSAEDLRRHILDQYLDSRSGFGSYFADNIGRSGTGYQLDNSINQIENIIADANKSGKPLTPEHERLLLSTVNGAVETFTKDLTNFKESKAACAEYTATTVMAALTVVGAVATGGGSVVVQGGLAAANTTQSLSRGARGLQCLQKSLSFAQSAQGDALINCGLQMTMMGNDYDLSSIPTDLTVGFVSGKMFELAGPVQAGRMMRLGDGTAQMTSELACTTIFKDEALGLTRAITTEQGQKIFQSTLKREVAKSINEAMLVGGRELAPNALRAATGKALRESVEHELKQNAGKITKQELENRVQKQLTKLAEEQIGPQALREMKEGVEREVRQNASKLVPKKLVDEQIERTINHQLAEVAAGSCERVLVSSLDHAGQQQGKNIIKGLLEFSGDQAPILTRFLRGMGMSGMGGAIGGTGTGIMQGLIQWDKTKSFEENMNAMREHVTGNIVASIVGATQTHPLSMAAHHVQTRRAANHQQTAPHDLTEPKGLAEPQAVSDRLPDSGDQTPVLDRLPDSGDHLDSLTEQQRNMTNHLFSLEQQQADAFTDVIELPEGTIRLLHDGTTAFTDHSGAQLLKQVDRVVAIKDAEGRQTHISYDQSGAVNQLDMSTPGGNQRWVRNDDGSWKIETAHGTLKTDEKVSVKSDGRLIFETDYGSKQIKHLDGSVEHFQRNKTAGVANLNENVQRQKLQSLIEKQVQNSDVGAHLLADMDILSERIITGGKKDRRELAETFSHTSDMLQDIAKHHNDPETKQRMERVAEEMLWMAAHPQRVSQGNHSTCALASAESRSYTEHPAETTKIMKELALTGEFRCPDGTVLKPFTADGAFLLQPDADALAHYDGKEDRKDGKRLFASQMFQTLIVSAHYADHDYYNGEYIGKGKIGYFNDHVVDLGTNPPRVLSEEAGPGMLASEVTWAFEKLTGRHEEFVLQNKRYDDSKFLSASSTFDSPEGFAHVLFANQVKGKLPISVQLHTFHEPFHTDSNEHHIAGLGGEHLLNVVKVEVITDPSDPRKLSEINPENLFDPATGKLNVNPDDVYVSVTNQWHKSANHIYKKIPLSELYRATTDPLDVKNLRALEKEIQNRPDNLDKQLDLIRYKNEFENRRAALTEELAVHPDVDKAAQLTVIDSSKDCITPARMIEEVNRLTSLKMQEIAERAPGYNRPNSADMAMMDKAEGLLMAADRQVSTRAARSGMPAADAHMPTSSTNQNRANRLEAKTAEQADIEQLRKQLIDAKIELKTKQKECLEDSKVKDTLSEFGFEYKLAEEIERATLRQKRIDKMGLASVVEQPSVVVAFIDLNNFKNVNVLHSMDMGDQALKEFGKQAASVLDKHGYDPKTALGHFGGDEFGLLLTNPKKTFDESGRPITDDEKHAQVLNEIMSIRIGCKPLSNDPKNQKQCEFEVLAPKQDFDHTAYKVEIDKKTGEPKVSEQSSPIISATVGAVRWKAGMNAEDVLQTADKVMFVKKPVVKDQLKNGGDAVLDPFDKNVNVERQKESEQLKLYRRLSDNQEDFLIHGMTYEQLAAHRDKTATTRENLYFDLLYKHRHTKILGKETSKNRLKEYISEATAGDGDESFTIIKLSVDNFKQVNDRMQSHAKGNRVLADVGKFVRGLDADFVGSLGGTSPFLIVKDSAKVDEIMKKCEKYFLEVSKGDVNSKRINNHTDVTGDNIAVGISSGKVKWQKGMDVETLLDLADQKTEVCQQKHAREGRHTNREENVPRKEGEAERRNRPDVANVSGNTTPNSVSLADNVESVSRKKGNVPGAGSGDWTYSNFDRIPVTDKFLNERMHVREFAIDDNGNLKITREHPFFTKSTMDGFADAMEPTLDWKRFKPTDEKATADELDRRRQVAENSINTFLRQQNLPAITIETGSKIDAQLDGLNAKAGYKNSTGKIMVRSADLLNVANPEFISALYHEILHAEQDVAMIRASALDSVRTHAKNAKGQQQLHTDEPTLIDETRKHYLKVAGLYNVQRDSALSGNEDTLAVKDWISKIVKLEHSRDWIKDRESISNEDLKLKDGEYRRADWLRHSYLAGEAKGARRSIEENADQVKNRVEYLKTIVDNDRFPRPFRLDELDTLKKLNADDPAIRVKTYGYDPLQTKFQKRDQTFTELLQSDPAFAEMVRDGNRRGWLKAYDEHTAKLAEKAKDCDLQISALNKDDPNYQKRLEQLQSQRPDYQDGPRTLKLLTRWELKGLIHGMNEKSHVASKLNFVLADHFTLVKEDASNQRERVRYGTTMRKGEEQEAYYVTQKMADRTALKIAERKEKPANDFDINVGLVHSEKRPSDGRLVNLNTEELQLQAGGKWASESHIALVADTVSQAADRMKVVDPANNPRLIEANQNWKTAYNEAHEAIDQRLPGLLPRDKNGAEDLFYDRKLVRQALEDHPDLLDIYENAIESYVDYRRVCRDEINTVRRDNAEIINQALAELAEYSGEPPMEVHTTHLGTATAAHKLGTNRLFITDDALRGMVSKERLIEDISHEFSHNAQNSLIVRNMANELGIDSQPGEVEIARLQQHYLQRIGQPLESEYLLSALKGNRNLSEGDKLRAEELVKSFSEIRIGDNLRSEKNLVDWALKKLSSENGASAIIEQALNQGSDLESVANNSVLRKLFPSYTSKSIISLLDKYLDNSPEWHKDAKLTGDFWKLVLEQRQKQLNELVSEHHLRYQDWFHEKESSAATELVSRHLQKNYRRDWGESGSADSELFNELQRRRRSHRDDGDEALPDGLVLSRAEARQESIEDKHRTVLNLTEALSRALDGRPLSESQIGNLNTLKLNAEKLDRTIAEKVISLLSEKPSGRALLDQIAERPLSLDELKGVQQMLSNNERIVSNGNAKTEVVDKVRAEHLLSLDHALLVLEKFADTDGSQKLNARDSLHLLQAQHLAQNGLNYLAKLHQPLDTEIQMQGQLKAQLKKLDAASTRLMDKSLANNVVEFISSYEKLAAGNTAGLDADTQTRLSQNMNKSLVQIFFPEGNGSDARQASMLMSRLNDTVNLLTRDNHGSPDDQIRNQLFKELSQRNLGDSNIGDAIGLADRRSELIMSTTDGARRQIVQDELEKSLQEFAKNPSSENGSRLQFTRELCDSANGQDGRFEMLSKFAAFANQHPDIPLAFRQVSAPDAIPEAVERYLDLMSQHAKNTTEITGDTTKDQRHFDGDELEDACVKATMEAARRGDLGDWTFVPTGKMSTADKMKLDGVFIDLQTGEIAPIDFTARDKGAHKWFYKLSTRDSQYGNQLAVFQNSPENIRGFIEGLRGDGTTFQLDQFKQAGIPFPSFENWSGATPAAIRDLKAIANGAKSLSRTPNDKWAFLGTSAYSPVHHSEQTRHPNLHSSDPMKAAKYEVIVQKYLKGQPADHSSKDPAQVQRDMVDLIDHCNGSVEDALKTARMAPVLRNSGVSNFSDMAEIGRVCDQFKTSPQEAAKAMTIWRSIGNGGTLKQAIQVSRIQQRLNDANVTITDEQAFKALDLFDRSSHLSPLVALALDAVPDEHQEYLQKKLAAAGNLTKQQLSETALTKTMEAEGEEAQAWSLLYEATEAL